MPSVERARFSSQRPPFRVGPQASIQSHYPSDHTTTCRAGSARQPARGCSFRRDPGRQGGRPASMTADRRRVVQVLDRLLANAARTRPRPSRPGSGPCATRRMSRSPSPTRDAARRRSSSLAAPPGCGTGGGRAAVPAAALAGSPVAGIVKVPFAPRPAPALTVRMRPPCASTSPVAREERRSGQIIDHTD